VDGTTPTKFDDEIELIDYLRVIWKWKYVIVAGTLFFHWQQEY